ncbi:hypothetical protein ACIO1C_29480 [Streptomyces sp. NPDC087420]|uniref:hypothetical protein n=1 Tax=Streptomyces sp. NPDC087420 TaxID=3365785 RepID=UPI0038339F5E
MDLGAVGTVLTGAAIAWLIGQAYYPLMFAAFAADDKNPPPPPAPEPERSPGWCHTHGTHRDNEK